MKRWTPLRVTWVDSATGGDGWHEVQKSHPVHSCITVGMFWGETKDSITLVGSRDTKTPNVLASLSIPRCAIEKLEVLR